MKASKIALYLILLPIAVIVVASSLFLAFFDANDYKQELTDYVKQSSGRSLIFHGEAELMLYPSFGMKLGAMEFSNAPGFGSTPMLSVKEVSISVDVKSVLMLQPKVSQLILSELQIDLQKNKQGVTNWDDLVPKKIPSSSKDDAQPVPKAETQDGEKFNIAGAFEGININNAKVTWTDASTGESFSLDDLDFTTGKITPTEAFPLALHLEMSQQKAIKVALDFETNVFFDLNKQMLSLKELDLKLQATGDLIPVNSSEINLTANVNFDLEKQFLNIAQLELQSKTQGGIMQKTDVNLEAEVTMNLASQLLNITRLTMTADIVDASMPKGELNSSLQSKHIKLALKQRAIDISELKLEANNIQLTGEVEVKDYAQPALSFTLASPKIDLDELLGLNEGNKTAPSDATDATDKPAEDSEIALPTELLRQLKLDGKLTITTLKAMNVSTSNNQLTLKASNGLVQIKPLSLEMYEGTLSQFIDIDVRGEQPKFKLKTNLDQVQIGTLLIDFLQLDKIRGAATIAVDVETQGTWVSQLKSNLDGTVAMRFADGALKGFNLRHLSEVAKAKLSGDKAPKESTQETDFTELSLSGTLKKGVFYSDDLSLKSPLIRVGGVGQVDLNTNEVDYTVNSKIIASLEGQSGAGLEASGLLIPVRVFGPFSAIKTDILLDNMLKQQAEEKLEKTKAALNKQKQAAQAAIAKQQAELKAQQQQKLDAEKQALQAKQDKAKAELEAQKAIEKQKLEAKKKEAKEKAKKDLENKLKGLF